MVQTDSGVYRRNRRHLRPSHIPDPKPASVPLNLPPIPAPRKVSKVPPVPEPRPSKVIPEHLSDPVSPVKPPVPNSYEYSPIRQLLMFPNLRLCPFQNKFHHHKHLVLLTLNPVTLPRVADLWSQVPNSDFDYYILKLIWLVLLYEWFTWSFDVNILYWHLLVHNIGYIICLSYTWSETA